MEAKRPLEIFFSYAHKDEELRNELGKQIRFLERQGYITGWYDRNISAGTEWSSEINKHLETAQIILLLISPDFMHSDYCYSVEMIRALARHEVKEARVIPIILRATHWYDSPFGKLQALPKNGEAVTSWVNRDEAFLDVAKGIQKAVEELRSQYSTPFIQPESTTFDKTLSIQGAAYPIKKVFSNEYIFTIPLFQRSYAWTTEEAEELLDDLVSFVNNSSEQSNEYFLGSIVLIKGNKPYAAVVDGQQRLTTLTILLAALRALLPQYASVLTGFLFQEGNEVTQEPTTYRLILRERDEEFFQNYIQRKGGIQQIKSLDATALSESQKNIRENALLFLQRLDKFSEEQRLSLAKAIVARCFLVLVSTPSFESAYRIFSVLNDRGLDLTPSDILKAEILGKIPPGELKEYTKRWEDIEQLLGNEMFQALFADICIIYRKSKLLGTVLTEFRQYVQPIIQSSQQFIDEILQPYANAFYTITKAAYEGNQGTETMNSILMWLNQIENSDWIPPAIHYFVRNQCNAGDLLHFFTDLERLAAGLMILKENASRRIERFSQLLRAIDDNQDLYILDSALQLTDEEQRRILAIFRSDVSPIQGKTLRYVLLRLNAGLSGGRAPDKDAKITIEQVLPESLTPKSTWVQWFGASNRRKHYANSLGNMVLLLRKKDSKLQNLDFDEKKQRYFSSEQYIVPFELTRQVLQETEWTPAVLERRQRSLIDKLRDIWRL